MVLLLWQRDLNRMYSYRVSTVDVPVSPIATAEEVRDSNGVTPCIVMKNDRLCTNKCRPFLLSPCDYDLFAKVKVPGTTQ